MNSYGQGDYTEFHARSAFSFHRGTSTPEALVARAGELGMQGLAICDRDGVYGSARQHQAAGEAGIRAIVGAELTLEGQVILPVIARTRTGYQNLCRMITTAKLRAAKQASVISWEELAEHHEGLVCLTGDEEGPLRRALRRGEGKRAAACLRRLVRFFGRRDVYVELQRHRQRREVYENRCLMDLAAEHGLSLLATNGVCYALPRERDLYDAFTCLRNHVHLDQAGRLLAANSERYLKGGAVMQRLFADEPEALANTRRLAERIEFTLENLGYAFPRYAVAGGETMASVLRRETYAGARRRYATPLRAAVKKQLDHELRLIEKLGFCGYFLIVWDIVNYARTHDILVQGRGSAANSAVCYVLGITNADPVGGKLLFERFLSEGRESWPDIDLDLPSGDRREQVIQEVYRRYAPRGAAMVANVITYRRRSAIREMGKVLGLPQDTLRRFADLYGSSRVPPSEAWGEGVGGVDPGVSHPRLPALAKLYEQVYGLPRHLGQHSGGMIISDRGLDTVVPLENATMPGRVVVQWDKDDCEDLGIVKVDLLGLGMVAAIQDTLITCRERGPEREVDLATMPKDDAATYRLMQRADTIGVFQIESRAQMATLPRLRPEKFYDLVIEVAIIRPGPIVGDLVHPYINRRNGREKVSYIDERFKPVLERTLGVPLFQEQILRMAMVIADFTGSEAEELRRAMSFHRSEERMRKVVAKLRAAMGKKGVPAETQDRVVDAIKSFALYGFPESHAISFALLAYASAWLKTHRAVEFYASLLNNQPMGFYSCATLVKDAKQHGIRVLPVSVIDSELKTRVLNDHTMQLGLKQVRGLARECVERLLAARAERLWDDLDDFRLRSRLKKDEARVLAKIGALNGLVAHRREALWQVEKPVERDLFNWQTHGERARQIIPLKPMDKRERLEADYAGLGLSVGPHPMALLRKDLPHVWRASDLARGKDGQIVIAAGLVICRQRPSTAKGHVFVSLEDETGIANAFVPAPTFEAYRLVVKQEPFLSIKGRLQNLDNVISLYALHIDPLPLDQSLATSSHDFH